MALNDGMELGIDAARRVLNSIPRSPLIEENSSSVPSVKPWVGGIAILTNNMVDAHPSQGSEVKQLPPSPRTITKGLEIPKGTFQDISTESSHKELRDYKYA